MSTQVYSSTSTTDLYQRRVAYETSVCQTVIKNDDDEFANYEEMHLEKPMILSQNNIVKKSDQTVLCRVNRYSVSCLTKPAALLHDETANSVQ